GRDPAEEMRAFEGAGSGVRMNARRENSRPVELERSRDRVTNRVREPRREAEQVAHEQAYAPVLATKEERADFEIVVHLGCRLVVDDSRELHGRGRGDDRSAEAGFQRSHHTTSVIADACAAER